MLPLISADGYSSDIQNPKLHSNVETSLNNSFGHMGCHIADSSPLSDPVALFHFSNYFMLLQTSTFLADLLGFCKHSCLYHLSYTTAAFNSCVKVKVLYSWRLMLGMQLLPMFQHSLKTNTIEKGRGKGRFKLFCLM